ncbi:TetR/AcrR family transcriptional regulator [Nonomuraea sp. PA05]|nr:TetR/AcrR family transcriptional regulator [Nonomuraea sp. PA05]
MPQAGRKQGRPPRLSRDLIVATALTTDLGSLTMRELADRLGVSHSALYRWVRNREDLFHMISDVVVDRILPTTDPAPDTWQAWLAELAWSMHDEFLAVPGYAVHVALPHTHNPHSFARLRDRVIAAFRAAGASPEMAEQSWYVFGLGVVQWLGARQAGVEAGATPARFDLFLDVLLRGLPVRLPVAHPRPQDREG